MSLTRRVSIRIEAEQAAWFSAHHGRRLPLGSWLEVDGECEARAVSALLHATVAELELSTSVGQVWLHGYVDGALTRELLYADRAWQLVRGEPFEFEDHRAMNRWLSKKRFLADDAGERIYEALLGQNAVSCGRVSARHLRDDSTPDELAPAVEPAVEPPAPALPPCPIAPRAAPEHEWVMYLLAEARHAWAKPLVPPSAEFPTWVPCFVEESPPAVSEGVDCVVVAASHTRLTNSLSVSVFEGTSFLRMVTWENGTWFTDGAPFALEDARATASLMASASAPTLKRLVQAFLGPRLHPDTSPLSQAALAGLLKRPG